MDDFTNEKALLEEVGAGIAVTGGDDLYARIGDLLKDAASLKQRGDRGREAVIANMGAAKRYAAMIGRHLPTAAPGGRGAGRARGRGET